MKKSNSFMIIMLIFSTLIITKILIKNIPPKTKETTSETTNEIIVDEGPNNFNYVYERFKVFNSEIDSSTVTLFNNVCKHYDLDTSALMLEWCVGQILLESGAKQYYGVNHPNKGKLVVSYAGAVGFSQIMPRTAHEFLSKKISSDEIDDMVKLGCTPFDFINSSSYTKSQEIDMVNTWLKNQDNNIILWGFIMRTKLDKRPNILKVLVAYNSGTTGMINYVNNGGLLSNHEYVRGIKTKLKYAENHISSMTS